MMTFFLIEFVLISLMFFSLQKKYTEKLLISTELKRFEELLNSYTFTYLILAILASLVFYLLHLKFNYLYSFLITIFIVIVIYFSFDLFKKKEKVVIKKEFNLPIKAIDRDFEKLKAETYFFKYYYTIENSIVEITFNKNIANLVANDLKKYTQKNKANSLLIKELAKKFDVEIDKNELLIEAHKKIIKKVKTICNQGGIVRVQQLLQYCNNWEDKAFIYFLSQLCTKKFNQLATQYAIFALKDNLIKVKK